MKNKSKITLVNNKIHTKGKRVVALSATALALLGVSGLTANNANADTVRDKLNNYDNYQTYVEYDRDNPINGKTINQLKDIYSSTDDNADNQSIREVLGIYKSNEFYSLSVYPSVDNKLGIFIEKGSGNNDYQLEPIANDKLSYHISFNDLSETIPMGPVSTTKGTINLKNFNNEVNDLLNQKIPDGYKIAPNLDVNFGLNKNYKQHYPYYSENNEQGDSKSTDEGKNIADYQLYIGIYVVPESKANNQSTPSSNNTVITSSVGSTNTISTDNNSNDSNNDYNSNANTNLNNGITFNELPFNYDKKDRTKVDQNSNKNKGSVNGKNAFNVDKTKVKVDQDKKQLSQAKNSLEKKTAQDQLKKSQSQLNKEVRINNASNEVQKAKSVVKNSADKHSRAKAEQQLKKAQNKLTKVSNLNKHKKNLKLVNQKIGQSTNYEQLGKAQNQANIIHHKIQQINKLF